jgi:putative flippase GtrA
MTIFGIEILDDLIFKFLRFCVVGGLGTVIDFGITYLCKEKLGWNKYLSNTLGFAISATVNYYFNRIWTFESHNQDIVGEYFKFLAVAITGLIINNIILWVMQNKFNQNFWISKVIATGLTIVWNFFASKAITFAKD